MKSNISNKNKVIILFVSLLNSYDHLVTTLLYSSTTPILEDIIDSLIKYYHQKKDIGKAHDKRWKRTVKAKEEGIIMRQE
ncbi:unnamed protein product [Spirodela intermedia]|uniref:Uncharacterized protein n=1 Tax=Spirodela intermedia TaxID=51605 RepID=A0A7I8JJN9_SPIIN|nr:unnamed protein product [Spirodela intermedia]CAA6670386.1 unnamed protein product [Spirodela intermedia]